MIWAATMAVSSPANLETLANYGVLGVFATILVLFALRQIKREQERSDRLEARLDKQNDTNQERVIPALQSSATAIQAAVELLREIQRERELEIVRREAAGK